MSKHSKKIWLNWKLWITIALILIIGVSIIVIITKDTKSKQANSINLGDFIILNMEQKELLKSESIENIKKYLKSPATAIFQEDFEYLCTEPNIVQVKGKVDSQNSFGALLRSEFICEYFVIGDSLSTLVYLKIDETELFNIKETYINEYKKQVEIENINKEGAQLNQQKLEYIKTEFNNEKWNDVGEITKVQFDEKQSQVDVKITAKSSKDNEEQKKYWINYNICSILHYFKDFEIVGEVKITLYDFNNNKSVEITFDNIFIKDKWKDNSQINLVEDLFGENYKQM